MNLIIGGHAQGKLNAVLNDINDSPIIVEGSGFNPSASYADHKTQTIIINHFHLWVKEMLSQGRNPQEEIFDFLEAEEENRTIIIICDEIGNGIVPIDAFEREYREVTGRILIELAKKADEVIRVICGLKQKIK